LQGNDREGNEELHQPQSVHSAYFFCRFFSCSLTPLYDRIRSITRHSFVFHFFGWSPIPEQLLPVMLLVRRALNLRLALQAMAIKVSANLVVQFIRRWNSQQDLDPANHVSFDPQHVIEFAVYGFLGSQVGNVIQFILEDWFPTGGSSHTQSGGDVLPRVMTRDDRPIPLEDLSKKDDDKDLSATTGSKATKWLNLDPNISWRNTMAKLILDQTIGLLITSTFFLTITNIARVPHPLLVLPIIRERLWPLIKAGWHLWPLVAICNFLWVPVRSRVLVAVCVGFGWSIFLSIFSMRK
jgi:hypothetical protein